MDVSMAAINLLRGLTVQLLEEHWEYLVSPAASSSRTISTSRYLDITSVYRFYGRPPAPQG